MKDKQSDSRLEQAALHALGALDGMERLEFERLLEDEGCAAPSSCQMSLKTQSGSDRSRPGTESSRSCFGGLERHGPPIGRLSESRLSKVGSCTSGNRRVNDGTRSP